MHTWCCTNQVITNYYNRPYSGPFIIFLFPDNKWNSQEFGSQELQHTRDSSNQQNESPNHHQAPPTHGQTAPPARQHAHALRKVEWPWWWQGAKLKPQHAAEVWKILGGDSNMCQVSWRPRSNQPSGGSDIWGKYTILEPSQDSGQWTVIEHWLALVGISFIPLYISKLHNTI